MDETTYIFVNTGKSLSIQVSALALIIMAVALLYCFREQTGGAILPSLLIFPATGLVALSRKYKEKVEYNPPQSPAERALFKRYKRMKRLSGFLLCAMLVVLEYCAVLRWGGAVSIYVISVLSLLGTATLAYAVAREERFQRRHR